MTIDVTKDVDPAMAYAFKNEEIIGSTGMVEPKYPKYGVAPSNHLWSGTADNVVVAKVSVDGMTKKHHIDPSEV